MPNIESLNVNDIREELENRVLSASELICDCFERIGEKESDVGAFITLCEDSAKRAATVADEKIKKGESLPLLGVPFAVKDNFCAKDIPTTCGSKILENYIPPYTATAVERLVSMGAVLIGKTNMDEFGMGSRTENSAFLTTRNPIDPTRSAGGSSGGSAAAVAAGYVPFAIGSDTGGSVRLPAAFCGCFGIKPTYGRISRYGLVSFASSLDTVGIISRTAKDSELLLSILSGKDSRDATSLAEGGYEPSHEIAESLADMRIGLVRELFDKNISTSVRSVIDRAIDRLREMGAIVKEISLPSIKLAAESYYVISSAEASSNLSRFDGVRYGERATDAKSFEELYLRSRSEGFGKEVKRRILLGAYCLSEGYYDKYYKNATAVREKIYSEFCSVFEDCDLLLSPMCSHTAPRLGDSGSISELYSEDIFTVPASLAGIPAASMPIGNDEQGLPVGLQIMAPRLGERKIFTLAKAYEGGIC